jgi:2-polyprenyl-6-hydroxyphenyl methylase / 3-demethylubiquinone-9 3-methyltransferase
MLGDRRTVGTLPRMPVDNEIYDRLGDTWWQEGEMLNLLRTVMNPARFGYFREVLLERLALDPSEARALDVGCGGGLLAEEFARLGCRVTGVDPSERSLETARAHAADARLDIEYRKGVGEALPFEAAAFDVVYCCDVLEHVESVPTVVAEIGRVLRPGGVFLYDTINRTPLSNLVFIKIVQDWLHLLPQDLHAYEQFVTPAELRQALAAAGLRHRETIGIRPSLNPLSLPAAVLSRGRNMKLVRSRDTSGSYAGFAQK